MSDNDQPQGDDLFSADQRREAQSEAQKRVQMQFDSDLQLVMSMPAGRRLMWQWLDRAGVWRLSYAGERGGTDFREGMRNIGLSLIADLKAACPDQWLRMQEEHKR